MNWGSCHCITEIFEEVVNDSTSDEKYTTENPANDSTNFSIGQSRSSRLSGQNGVANTGTCRNYNGGL